MKRKVIQLAGKTHVVSLPSKWVKNYNIKKGEELQVEELGNHILIKPEKSETEQKKISFNIDKLDERTFRYTISALHKLGYDEITLHFEKTKHNDTIQHLLQNLLLGFVVIEQTSKKVVLKNVSNEIESEFNPTLRRAFLVTLSLANSSLEMMSSEKFTDLSSLINLENSNNQLTSFCLRLINRGFYKEQDKKLFIVTMIWGLEKIADEYKEICINFSNYNKEISKDLLKIYKEVNNFFNEYYELIYKFSAEKVNELVHKKQDIIKNIYSIKPQNKQEIQLLNSLYSITSKTADLSSSIFAINHKELLN